jgi:hypothetical protein
MEFYKKIDSEHHQLLLQKEKYKLSDDLLDSFLGLSTEEIATNDNSSFIKFLKHAHFYRISFDQKELFLTELTLASTLRLENKKRLDSKIKFL